MNNPSRYSGRADLGRATSPRRALAAAACLAWAATLASSAAFAEPEAHAEAAQAYQRQHFAAALAGYERLAMQGDCEAAERAGLMLLFGQRLYGDAAPRDLARAPVAPARRPGRVRGRAPSAGTKHPHRHRIRVWSRRPCGVDDRHRRNLVQRAMTNALFAPNAQAGPHARPNVIRPSKANHVVTTPA
jgi:hypothetical protein